jgi:hypothetical protein
MPVPVPLVRKKASNADLRLMLCLFHLMWRKMRQKMAQ